MREGVGGKALRSSKSEVSKDQQERKILIFLVRGDFNAFYRRLRKYSDGYFQLNNGVLVCVPLSNIYLRIFRAIISPPP